MNSAPSALTLISHWFAPLTENLEHRRLQYQPSTSALFIFFAFAGLLLGGVACIPCAFVESPTALTGLAAVSKFGIAGSYTVASIYTSELFPTFIRSAVLGVENEAARLGGIAAPFIVLIGTAKHSMAIPFLIFGTSSLLAGLLFFTMPETLGTALPDTMSVSGAGAAAQYIEMHMAMQYNQQHFMITYEACQSTCCQSHGSCRVSVSGQTPLFVVHVTRGHTVPAWIAYPQHARHC